MSDAELVVNWEARYRALKEVADEMADYLSQRMENHYMWDWGDKLKAKIAEIDKQ